MKTNKIGAIDIGTTKICSLIAETDGTGLRVLGIGSVPSKGLQKGQVVNIAEARESVRASIRAAEKTAGFRMDSAVVSMSGKHVSSGNKRGVISITGNRKQTVEKKDVERLLEITRSENMPPEETVLHQIPRYFRVDGQDGVKDPVGMFGYRLDVETHTITASVTSLENLTKCVVGAGVKIDNVVFEPLASAASVLTEDEKRDGVLLADIGGGTTNIAVYKNDSVYYSSVISVAGNQISRDISLGLGLNPELSEELKVRYGSLIPLPQTEKLKPLLVDGEEIAYEDLFDIIHIRTEELLRLVLLQVNNDTGGELDPSTLPAGIVFTGGTANLPGIAEMAQQVTQAPCRIGYPPRVSGIADSISGPEYAASFGLLLWKMETPEAHYRQKMNNRIFKNTGVLSRVIRIFGK
ncbi:MAG: cell division protein FtsA [Dehalococcoidales bacterium]|nr:cell division protein FtsA [Dehalococcoidales bacterium]MDX9985934.1 cell division protein FtsA [Dehalococcoidales bacterium]NLE89723.1 cell division protein FtsA [Dehalococcoidales bacterium]